MAVFSLLPFSAFSPRFFASIAILKSIPLVVLSSARFSALASVLEIAALAISAPLEAFEAVCSRLVSSACRAERRIAPPELPLLV